MLAGKQDPFTGAPLPMSEFFAGKQPSPVEQAEQMKEEMERVAYERAVLFKRVRVKDYYLNIPENIAQYEKDSRILWKGVQAKTHVILDKQKVLVTQNLQEGERPFYYIHIEWSEYKLKEKAVAPVGTPKEHKPEAREVGIDEEIKDSEYGTSGPGDVGVFTGIPEAPEGTEDEKTRTGD